MGLKKSLGQNFIFDKNYLLSLVKNATISDKIVLEVGCGNGNLTEVLLEKAQLVIGFEIDNEWCHKLYEKFAYNSKLILVCEDFLTYDLEKLNKRNMVFFSNIPYYISSKIIEKLIKNSSLFENYYMMVQWEFAKRLFATTGSKDYGALSVFFQSYFSGKIVKKIPPTVFTPKPKVYSALINFHNDKKVDANQDFEYFIKVLFSQRRKQLINVLNGYCKKKGKNDIINILRELNINEKERVENIALNFLFELYNYFFKC